MKRSLLVLVLVCILGLVGCGKLPEEDNYQQLEKSTNITEVEETELSSETDDISNVTNNLSHDKKMEILAYINGILDPLCETDITDEQLETRANEVWSEAEEKFDITENDILNIMTDTDLIYEYYSNVADTSNGDKSSVQESTVLTYDATLDNNGYRVTVAATDDYLSEFIKYISNSDTTGVENMYNNGYISYVPDGTKVFITDMGFASSKVKILEGDLKDLEVYVINECIEIK